MIRDEFGSKEHLRCSVDSFFLRTYKKKTDGETMEGVQTKLSWGEERLHRTVGFVLR